MNRWRLIWLLFFSAALASCQRHVPVAQCVASSQQPQLSAIDTLMQSRPDSALKALYSCKDTSYVSASDRHYYQLLLSEALYKNDSTQQNRPELLNAMAYFDSIGIPFLSARCHYMNGVYYYETDSVVSACEEYMKALEIMESHFKEKDLTGYKAKFMALAYTRLTDLFMQQFLHLQSIKLAQKTYYYYKKQDFQSLQLAWTLNTIGLNFDMMEQFDSATYYYQTAISILEDTNKLIYRDIVAHQALIDYKTNSKPVNNLSRLQNLLSQSESDEECLARCLFIGEIFYHEKELDSASLYLNKVFLFSNNVSAKRQAAEWLVDINKSQGKDIGVYSSFLVPFANLNENKGIIKSQLVEMYRDFEKSWLNNLQNTLIRKEHKWLFMIFGLALGIVVIVAISFFRQSKRERQEYQIKHAALAGRLKQSNAELKRIRKKIKEKNNTSSQSPIIHGNNHLNYEEEPICQHIIKICNDVQRPIKSTIPVSEYADIALTNRQKAQLYDAVARHYDWFFEKLKKEHPNLKEKDFTYCYLCLLGLNNVQIAALLQKTPSTIWDREKRLQDIFGKKESISIALYTLLKNK